MAVTTVTRAGSGTWVRIAFAMLAVGWGANQFSPMLIVYRHELRLGAAAVAGLFLVYALTLIPGLLVGGPASDRFGRRPVVLPFVILSPLATLLLVLGPRSLVLISVGRALAGLCSGVVFGSATAWVQELSHGTGQSARRAAFALTAGFGLGPVVAAVLAQWAPQPLLLPYVPHLVIGVAAAIVIWPAPEGSQRPARLIKARVAQARVAQARVAQARVAQAQAPQARVPRTWPPAAVRTWRFWLSVAPASPMVFGSVALAIVVLPEDVTSARTLSSGFAGLMTALAFAAGVAVQPVARRLANPLTGNVAGLCCAAAGAAIAVAAVAGADRVIAGVVAVLLGLAYGLCLVSGLRQAEQVAQGPGPGQRGAVVACYYALAYLGFGAPYLAAGLGAMAGQAGAFGVLAGIAVVIAAWTAWYGLRLGQAQPAADPPAPSGRGAPYLDRSEAS
jgi:Major Facilitator Superfamily